jgi:Concanavalin A-like lectin/glucanases superfamily
MIIQGVTLNGINAYDASFNGNSALLYVDAGNTNSYPGSGTTWTGLSNNASNATLVGSPPFTSAGTSSYFTFNGSGSQYASTTASKFNVTYTGKTVMFVARVTNATFNVGTFRGIFGTNSGTRNFNTYLYMPSAGVLQYHYSAGGLGGFSNNLSLAYNQWFFGAVTQTTGGLVTYYFNGVAVGTNTGVTFAQYASNGGEFIALCDNYWYGDIGMCAVYGQALTSDQIVQNYNSIKGRYGL